MFMRGFMRLMTTFSLLFTLSVILAFSYAKIASAGERVFVITPEDRYYHNLTTCYYNYNNCIYQRTPVSICLQAYDACINNAIDDLNKNGGIQIVTPSMFLD